MTSEDARLADDLRRYREVCDPLAHVMFSDVELAKTWAFQQWQFGQRMRELGDDLARAFGVPAMADWLNRRRTR